MSDSDQHDPITALAELEQLVRHLGDELAGFRKRALQAEGRVRELEVEAGEAPASSAEMRALERENARLRSRLETASGRARQILERVRFLRQQHVRGVDR